MSRLAALIAAAAQTAAIRPVSRSPGVPPTMYHGGDVQAAITAAKAALALPDEPKRITYPVDPAKTLEVETAIASEAGAFVSAYLEALNEAEVSPDGSDFNDLADGVLAILAGGATPVIPITEEGR